MPPEREAPLLKGKFAHRTPGIACPETCAMLEKAQSAVSAEKGKEKRPSEACYCVRHTCFRRIVHSPNT